MTSLKKLVFDVDPNRLAKFVARFENSGVTAQRLEDFCIRCNGTGKHPLGVCFRCRGSRVDPVAWSWEFDGEPTEAFVAFAVEQDAKLTRQANARAERERLRVEAAKAKWRADIEELVPGFAETNLEFRGIARDIVDRCSGASIPSSKQIAVLQREVENVRRRRSEKAKRDELAKTSEWIGEVGGKIQNVVLEFVFESSFEGRFGQTWILNFRDANGNSVKWFTSSPKSFDKGERVFLKATTIKSHDEWKGEKQTSITRPSFSSSALPTVIDGDIEVVKNPESKRWDIVCNDVVLVDCFATKKAATEALSVVDSNFKN